MDPEALWVYQGWIWLGLDNTQGQAFMKGFTSGVPPGKLLILDMEAEADEIWRWSYRCEGRRRERRKAKERNRLSYDDKFLLFVTHPASTTRPLFGQPWTTLAATTGCMFKCSKSISAFLLRLTGPRCSQVRGLAAGDQPHAGRAGNGTIHCWRRY